MLCDGILLLSAAKIITAFGFSIFSDTKPIPLSITLPKTS